MASVSGGISSNAGVSGVVNTLVVKNEVKSLVGDHVKLIAGYDSEDPDAALKGAGAGVVVRSADETDLYNLAGGVAVGSTVGVGASVVSMVYSKDMAAEIGDGSIVHTSGDLTIGSVSDDDSYLISLNIAASGTASVAVGANTQVFSSKVKTSVGGTFTVGGDAKISAESDADLFNIALAVSGSGTAAVTPVAVVSVFEQETTADLLDGASVIANGTFELSADSKELVTNDALGVSGSGVAAVSGTVEVLVSKVTTRASSGSRATMQGTGVKVRAKDDYDFVGTAATVAASGAAAVGVTAIVNVAKNTVNAYTGAGNTITATNGDVDVKADAERRILNYAASVAGSGAAAVGATIMVDVIGGKLSKDVHSNLMASYNSSGERTSGGLDLSKMGDVYGEDAELGGLYGKCGELDQDLASDGTSENTSIDFGSSNVADGYMSDDLQDGKGSSYGENHVVDDGANPALTRTEGLGQVTRNYARQDIVSASIGAGSTVTARSLNPSANLGNITVNASDVMTIDTVTATVSGAGVAGIGVGVAVVVSYSNVLADVGDGAKLSADGDVLIRASSSSVPLVPATPTESQEELNGIIHTQVNGDKEGTEEERQTSFLGLRAISVTGAGGIAGVGVSIAAVSMESFVRADLAGDVIQSDSITVRSITSYPDVMAVTLAASGGVAAVSTPISIIRTHGEAQSSISGNANVKTTGRLSVTGDHALSGFAAAAAFSGGVVAVNASLPIAVNALKVNTFIGQGVVASAGSVEVKTNAESSANAILLSAGGGAVAAYAAVAVSVDRAVVNTYIGKTPKGEPVPGASSGTVGKITSAGTVNVSNIVNARALTLITTFSGGAVSVNGNVLVAVETMDALAAISRTRVEAVGDISVRADVVTSEADADLLMANAGAAAVGVSMSYARNSAKNIALIDLIGTEDDSDTVKSTAGNIKLIAGDSSRKTHSKATARTIAANVGAVAVTENAAVADNSSVNKAQITGEGKLSASGTLTVLGSLESLADASLIGVTVGGISVTGTQLVSINRAANIAEAGGGSINASSVDVKAVSGNVTEPLLGTLPQAHSWILQGGAEGLVGVGLHIAVAYDRVENRAAYTAKNTNTGTLKVRSEGKADSLAETKKLANVSTYSAGLMTGFAYTQGSFDAVINVPEGGVLTASSINAEAVYTTDAHAEVTPSASGVGASLVSVGANIAVAKTGTSSTTGITGKGSVNTSGAINVNADGTADADGIVNGETVSVSGAKIAVSVAVADAGGKQKVCVEGVKITNASGVNVTSEFNDEASERHGANAVVGLTGSDEGASLSFASVKTNVADADMTATVEAVFSPEDAQINGAVNVNTTAGSYADAKVNNAGVDFSGVKAAVVVVNADADGTFTSKIGSGTVNARSVTVVTNAVVDAKAQSAQPNASISGASADVNVASADAGAVTNAIVTGSGKLNVTNNGALTITNNTKATADAKISGSELDASVVSVGYSDVDATVSAAATAGVTGEKTGNTTYYKDEVKAGSVSVTTNFNNDNSGATASVGLDSGVKIAMGTAKVNTADASIIGSSKALFGANAATVSGELNVTNNSKAYAKGYAAEGLVTAALVQASMSEISANANGSFQSGITAAKEGGVISASKITINNNYLTTANATGAAPKVSVARASGKVNLASSNAGTAVASYIDGRGTVTATNGVNVYSNGNATSDAVLKGTKVDVAEASIGLNRAIAENTVSQSSYVKNAKVTGTTLTVRANYNNSGSGTANATAKVGSNGGASVSLYGGKVNIAEANSGASVSAYLDGVSSDLSGDVNVAVAGNSVARSTVLNTSSVSLVNASLIETKANAKGNFASRINTTGGTLDTRGDINVKTTYGADAQATVSAAGGVSLDLVKADVNLAQTKTQASASSLVEGSWRRPSSLP